MSREHSRKQYELQGAFYFSIPYLITLEGGPHFDDFKEQKAFIFERFNTGSLEKKLFFFLKKGGGACFALILSCQL